MLMLILLNHYMFIEVMRYLHDNIGLKANTIKCILKPTALVTSNPIKLDAIPLRTILNWNSYKQR